MFYWSTNCIVVVSPLITSFCLGSLISNGTCSQVDGTAWTKCLLECLGTGPNIKDKISHFKDLLVDQMSLWMLQTGPNIC